LFVWRITRAPFQALDGEGARLYGGRWSPEGVAVVYTSTTLALAALEYLVHVDLQDVPGDLVAMRIRLPDEVSLQRVRVSDLPPDWTEVPDHPACVRIGEEWAGAARTAALRVPSAIVPEEYSVLINPEHPEARRMEVVHTRLFGFDPRLLP
jgi:RES domain-containing protein